MGARASLSVACFRFTMLTIVLILAVLLSACDPATGNSSTHLPGTIAPSTTSAPTPVSVQRYIDSKLGFSLELPALGWITSPEPGLHASPHISAVTLIGNEHTSHQLVVIGVFESSAMPAAFASRGTPTTHIGPYPAFTDDRMHGVAREPCLVRIFLAHDDYVMATWCAADAALHTTDFDQLLATYLPAAPGFVPHPQPAPLPEDCSGMEMAMGYSASVTDWGKLLASPSATSPAGGWRQLQSGAYICSNAGSPDLYLFQCTELVNRFLYEQWALPHIPGNAARYFDYYQNGRLYPGVIRDLPAGTYQLSSDASQSASAFRPQAGDLLIFQDVNDPGAGWISGLTSSPGHIAIITGTDTTHVYIAQENYNDTEYFLALPLTALADGWHITDLSGLSNRIVRGWIRLTLPQ
jgi:hypothetical protein